MVEVSQSFVQPKLASRVKTFSLLEVSSEDLYSVPEDGMKVSVELVTHHVRID